MNKTYDVMTAKEFTTYQNGKEERKKQWNKVGRAWPSKSGEAINIELFLIPNSVITVFMSETNKKVELDTKTEPSV